MLIRKHSFRIAMTLAVVVISMGLGLQPQKAMAQQGSSGLTPANQAVWDREWSLYASRYTQYEGEFYPCAKYHPGFPSSQHVTAQTLVERNTRSRTVTYGGNLSRQVRTVPSLADAQVAAAALPALTFGEYGHLHSVEIVQILGPKSMLVRQPWLVDAQAITEQIRQARTTARERNQNNDDDIENAFQFRQQLVDRQRREDSFRTGGILLMGFDTEDLKEGQRWLGPQKQGLDVAITGTKVIQYTRPRTSRTSSSTSTTSRSSRPREVEVTVALPLSEFKGRISRTQFDDLLTRRDMTLEQFIDLTAAEKKKDPEQAIFNAIRKLEARKDAASREEDAGRPATDATGRTRSLDD